MTDIQPTKEQAPAPDQEIIAPPGAYYRNARFVITLMLFGFGVWCIRDGFWRFPLENQQEIDRVLAEARKALPAGESLSEEKKTELIKGTPAKHGGYDILLNRLMGFALPPAGLFVVVWTLRNSRGQYRLAGDVLQIPGHPPIPLDSIHRLDQTRWERKGIAWVEYELPDGQSGRARIDDFIYQQDPTDAIMARIESFVAKKAGLDDGPRA